MLFSKKMEFTYLIGAGASAQTIPITKDFPDQLNTFSNYIKDFKLERDVQFGTNNANTLASGLKDSLYRDTQWLAKECNAHSSIDTFARKLLLANRFKELLILKTIISELLLTIQFLKGIDKRYDAFFASLLEKDGIQLSLPNNIKIISWNYDKQIEHSISQFLNSDGQTDIDEFIQISPRESGTSIDIDSFALFKLNGSIGGTIRNKSKYIPITIDYQAFTETQSYKIRQNFFLSMINRYYFVKQRIAKDRYFQNMDDQDEYPTIFYSWERNFIFDTVRNNTLMATKKTDILIIIGYSFPTFNRTLDKTIINNMKQLKKVFIQSPVDTIKGVTQRFKSLYEHTNDIEINEVTDVNEFYIPFEF